jgi:hypothetical protein
MSLLAAQDKRLALASRAACTFSIISSLYRFSPMTSTTPPISAAAEQNHHQNDDQDQVHGISPLLVAALFFRHLSDQRHPDRIVPMMAHCRTASNFRAVFTGRRRSLALALTATLSTRRAVADLPEMLGDCLRTLGVVQFRVSLATAFGRVVE